MHVVELCRLGTSRNLLLSPYESPRENLLRLFELPLRSPHVKKIFTKLDWLSEKGYEVRLELTTDMPFRDPKEYNTSSVVNYHDFMRTYCNRRDWLLYAVLATTEQLVEYNLVFNGD